jgi:hypothetical protein
MDACRYTSASAAAELSSKPEKFAMFTRWMTFLTCLACAVYLAAEALPRQLSPASRPFGKAGSLENVSFDPANRDGRSLLDQAVRKLKDVKWLRVAIWQRMHGNGGFESSGHLTLGPNDCAALELAVRVDNRAGAPHRQTVICDGVAIATIIGDGASEDDVHGQELPETRGGRLDVLSAHGCAPPVVLLRQLRAAVAHWQAEHGVRSGREVLRLSGPLKVGAGRMSRWAALGATTAYLELDPATLWPHRFEWRRGAATGPGALVLEMEYRDAEVNQPLSLQECARVFSYVPSGASRDEPPGAATTYGAP